MSNETRYPWNEAPEWAMFAATDRDGHARWLENKPCHQPSPQWFLGEWWAEGRWIAMPGLRLCSEWNLDPEPRPATEAVSDGVSDAECEVFKIAFHEAASNATTYGDAVRAGLLAFLATRRTK